MLGEAPRALAGRAELHHGAVGLIEVIADDLLELHAPAVEPSGEAFVQIGPELLRDALVRGVADQQVSEPEGVLDHHLGGDQLLPHERREMRPRRTAAFRSELTERLPFEFEPDHGRTLEEVTLVVGEAVEPCGEERVDGRGHLVGCASLRKPRERLLDVERVALRRVADPGPDLALERIATEQLLHQLLGLLVGERLKGEDLGAGLPSAPRGVLVEQLGSSEAEEQDGRVAGPCGEMVDQVEERRRRPVDVLDDEHERPLPGPLLERLADRKEDLLRRGRLQCSRELLLRSRRGEDLAQRPVRDALTIREAPSGEDVGLPLERRRDLVSEA